MERGNEDHITTLYTLLNGIDGLFMPRSEGNLWDDPHMFFKNQTDVISVTCLQEFVDSGLHSEFPKVLLEDALHLFSSTSQLDLPPFPRCDLDPYHTALLILSSHTDCLTALFARLQVLQCNFATIHSLVALHLSKNYIRADFEVAALATVFSPAVRKRLTPFLYAYLLLELLACETRLPEGSVCFSELPLDPDVNCRLRAVCSSAFSEDNESLSLSFLLHDLWTPFISSYFHHRTTELMSGVFTESLIDRLKKYVDGVVHQTWAKRTLLPTSFVFDTVLTVRRPELFSIMIEYPESHPALLDIKACLEKTGALQDLIDELGSEVRSRLLHSGVHTDQILLGYGCLVRALRVIDPSSVAQDIICQPVAGCLRARDDAVHCIVDRLISPPHDNNQQVVGLQRELLLPTPLEVEPRDEMRDGDAHLVAHDPNGCMGRNDGEPEAETETGEEEKNHANELDWDRWMPDPIEALHHTGLWRRRIDLLSLLVGIYGSKKAFLVVYRNLLSERLLKQLSFDTASQLRHLELLKLRFGETDMQECEVMLKDIRDSRRISTYVAESAANIEAEKGALEGVARNDDEAEVIVVGEMVTRFPVQAFVLSGEYWPEFHREQFKLPEALASPFATFTKCFERMKGNRSVEWLQKLGLVSVELERCDETFTMDVSPIQASLLHLFTRKARWNVRDLGQELEITASAVRRNFQPFLQLSIFEEVRSGEGSSGEGDIVYRVSTNRKRPTTHDQMAVASGRGNDLNVSCLSDQGHVDMETSPPAGGLGATRDSMNQELQVYWSYILGMLTNLGGLSLDRIHSMLRMFALGSSDSVECTRQQLHQFLEMKLRDGQLIYEDLVYKLP